MLCKKMSTKTTLNGLTPLSIKPAPKPLCFEPMTGLNPDATEDLAALEAEWAHRWPRGKWVRGKGVVA